MYFLPTWKPNLFGLCKMQRKNLKWEYESDLGLIPDLGVKSLTCKELCFPTSLLSGIFTVSMG